MRSLSERRAAEVDRQQRRNKRDAVRTAGYIICLILWAAALVGFVWRVVDV